MTSSVTVHTNGDYVSEGRLTMLPGDGGEVKTTTLIKVGPGHQRHENYYYHHGRSVVIELSERSATEDEIAAAKTEGRYYDAPAKAPVPPDANTSAQAAVEQTKSPEEIAEYEKTMNLKGQGTIRGNTNGDVESED